MQTRRLEKQEFLATMSPKMHDITLSATDVLDIWAYVQAVPLADLEGHAVYDRFVERVYRSGDGRFDHVLVMTQTKSVFLVVVVDLGKDDVYGHRLLDLGKEDGQS
jgi:hypothetical protein